LLLISTPSKGLHQAASWYHGPYRSRRKGSTRALPASVELRYCSLRNSCVA